MHITKGLHNVIGPGNGKYQAQCDIADKGNAVEFDYIPYETFNKKHNIIIGTMRLEFEDTLRTNEFKVFWKSKSLQEYQPISTEVSFIWEEVELEQAIEDSLNCSAEERKERLRNASKMPRKITVTTTNYCRNPDVVAEVLFLAKGICQKCNQPAPFKSSKTDKPYLEVHHLTRLADGGEDTVENAIAVCPNCHRKLHYG